MYRILTVVNCCCSCLSDTTSGVWIGFNDVTEEGKYTWSDGDHVFYTNWASGQPNNQYKNQDCGVLTQRGSWEDAHCGIKLPFICEKK